jgi:hypothetical protein
MPKPVLYVIIQRLFYRINILRLSNPFTIDIVFSPPPNITQFPQLEMKNPSITFLLI